MQTDYGLDTSRWQGLITQSDVDAAQAAGKTFWLFKGSGGDDGLYVDSQFSNTLSILRGSAFKRAVYHFSSPPEDGISGTEEAQYAVNNVWNQLIPGEIAMLDVDTFGASDPTWTAEFLNVAIPLLGYKPILYMNQNTENNLDWSPVVAMNVGLIIADYAVSPAGDVALKHWPFYFGQQYSDNGTVGALSPVDLDAVFVSDLTASWDAYAKPEPAPVEPTPPTPPAPTPGTAEAALANADPNTPSLTPATETPAAPVEPVAPPALLQPTPSSETSSTAPTPSNPPAKVIVSPSEPSTSSPSTSWLSITIAALSGKKTYTLGSLMFLTSLEKYLTGQTTLSQFITTVQGLFGAVGLGFITTRAAIKKIETKLLAMVESIRI